MWLAALLSAVALIGASSAARSSDTSCPDGYFCKQESCSSDVECLSGEECLNFEGHFACAPQGLKWCALNPTNLEAVACSSGSCCHGNCYSSDAVCCDFPSVQCSIGQLCNVCSPGQQCGDTECVISGPGNPVSHAPTTTEKASMSSTKSRSSTMSTVSEIPSTSARSTTSTALATSYTVSVTAPSTTSVTAPASMTSSSVHSPTIVSQISSFSFSGCFSDTVDARVLVANSTEDDSGMTPEDCVTFAKGGAWRYAGVEYGSQCFIGNTIHDSSTESDGDCNKPCAGNAGETCGGGNRIQIYEDSTWKYPTLEGLADAVRQYNSSVEQTKEAISTYHGHLLTLQGILDSSSSSGAKRAGSSYEKIELQMLGDQTAANQASTSLSAAKASGQRVLTIGRELDTIGEADPDVPLYALEEFEDAANMLAQQLSRVIRDLEENLDELTEAISTGIAPAIDIASSLTMAGSAITAIGVPVGATAGAATGIFLVMSTLLSLFVGNNSPVPTTTVAIPTSTAATTTSTSTKCISTATATSVIIFTKEGTSTTDFKDLIATLPDDPNSIQLTASWQPNFMYVGEMDQCTAEALGGNPIVDSWAIDADVDVEEFADSSTSTKRSYSVPRASNTTIPKDLSIRSDPTAQSTLVQQANSPSHLQWISQVSRYTNLTGNYYSLDDLIYNDPELVIGSPPIVYIIDTGFQNDHPDFADRVIGQLAVDDSGENLIPQTPALSNHGTCMTSLAAGAYSGIAKDARIVTAQLDILKRGVKAQARASRTFFLLLQVYRDIVSKKAEANAVVSMSFGVRKEALSWNLPGPGSTNVFETALNWFWAIGVTTVCSAGNGETSDNSLNFKDLSSHLPRGAGGSGTSLIVVGNSRWNATRNPDSNYRDVDGLGILSLYNIGTNVECAVLDSQWNVERAGTSQATAITGGMIAYYLTQPDLKADWTRLGNARVSIAAKKYLLDTANRYKGAAGQEDGIPRAALGEVVPCSKGTSGRPAEQNPRVPVTDHTLSTTQVTDGSEVVLGTLPQCWNLN